LLDQPTHDLSLSGLVRGLQSLSLRSYAYAILNFVRWWSQQPGVDVHQFAAEQFTESRLVDYVRYQLNQQPKPTPENINGRLARWMASAA
jgi:hypothetical protein